MAINQLTRQFLDQLDSTLGSYEDLKKQSRYDDLSDLGSSVAYDLITRARAAVERTSGRDSVYSKQLVEVLAIERRYTNDYERLKMIMGIVQSLRTDLQAGYLASASELIHGEVFADFLEMAGYLLEEGYKDAGAVIAGGTLEAHLRLLCTKHGIDTVTTTAGGVQAKKADRMNSDLSGIGIYSKLDQKNVTAWLDLRNKAAHARYSEYTTEQVSLLIAGIRDFVVRNPA